VLAGHFDRDPVAGDSGIVTVRRRPTGLDRIPGSARKEQRIVRGNSRPVSLPWRVGPDVGFFDHDLSHGTARRAEERA
jgi:hypothetical protein